MKVGGRCTIAHGLDMPPLFQHAYEMPARRFTAIDATLRPEHAGFGVFLGIVKAPDALPL